MKHLKEERKLLIPLMQHYNNNAKCLKARIDEINKILTG